ncbi:MAG: DUF1566 domain-containing protein [Campylobacterota bacterium]|nr:DUF1566 domain-containing protein [Campylobacterota bacterium]
MKKKILTSIVVLLLFTACKETKPKELAIVEKKESFIWDTDSKGYISQTEYDDAMEKYILKTYPKKVEAYKLKKKQERIRKEKQLERARQKEIARQKRVQREKERVRQKEIARQKRVQREKEIARQKRVQREKEIARQKRVQREKEIARQKKIRDNTTTIDGFMWQDNDASRTIRKDWQDAKNYCKNLSLVGYSDWRLPHIETLKRLHSSKSKLNKLTSYDYWSSSEDVSFSSDAWSVHFYTGLTSSSSLSNEYYVRCVRGRQ